MTETERLRAIDVTLSAFRMIAQSLGRAINALHDAEGFDRSVNADSGYANRIAQHREALKADILPEVNATIAGLEAERWQ